MDILQAPAQDVRASMLLNVMLEQLLFLALISTLIIIIDYL